MTLPQVPTPAGIPANRIHAYGHTVDFGPIPATSTDPSRLKALEKAVKTAKPMNKG